MNKEIQNYLNNLLTKIEPYLLTSDDRKLVERDLTEFIFKKLVRKEFRRKKLSEKTEKQIRNKIKTSIAENRPIQLKIPFGGYKHFWNESHPNSDWAELFHFRYMTDLVKPILACYKQGVIIEYISEDLILNKMNNYPKSAMNEYCESFRNLLDWYSDKVPKNLKFDFFRVGDRYDSNKIISLVEDLLTERKSAFDKLSLEDQEKELHRSNRAILWNGDKDLTSLNEIEKRNRIIESRLIELAYYDTEGKEEFLGDYFWRDNNICINFSFGLSPDNIFEDLTLGSSYGSIVDFWIGRGVLEYNNDKLNTRIISKNQYEESKDKIVKISTNISGLDEKNYQSIDVIKK